MIKLLQSSITRRALSLALPIALCLLFLLPAASEAHTFHAILLRSDPSADTVLTTPPIQVRMWFSEDLNPTFSTAAVVNPGNQRVDLKNAHVTSGDPREMDITVTPNLPASAYVVVWRTQSADDGHILRGSFRFSVAAPDGSVPTYTGKVSTQDPLGAGGRNELGPYIASFSTGQLDGSAIFSLIMTTLVELGVVFWVGAQFWHNFVLERTGSGNEIQYTLYQRTENRFDRLFSLPTLLIILIANVGVLVGQALSLTGTQWTQAFAPPLLAGLVTHGQFGTFWIMREIVTLLAIALAVYILLGKRRSALITEIIAWGNLLLGLAFLIAMTLSGHAAAVNSDIVLYAVIVDWLHLLAASLWVGGMMYIATIYLPILKKSQPLERTRSLLTTLPRYSPLAIVGVLIMSISGPFNAAVHMNSWNQLLSTAYGRTLDIKVLLVGALLLTSAVHVGLLRPRLKATYQAYQGTLDDLANEDQQTTREAVHNDSQFEDAPTTTKETMLKARGVLQKIKQKEGIISRQLKRMEDTIAQQTQRLTRVLSWEPLLGVGVLLCTGLLTVFAGTLQSATPSQAQQSQTTPAVKPYTTTIKTKDNLYTLNMTISPNRSGPNVFTATVMDSKGNVMSPDQVGVSLYTTMLDMDMGTSPALNLQSDGKGHFKGTGDLDMPGHWALRVVVRTLDNTLHETTLDFYTPS